MPTTYYTIHIILEKNNYFTLWGEDGDDTDRFRTDNGKLLSFPSLVTLMEYVLDHQLRLVMNDGIMDLQVFDLDQIAYWVKHPNKHIEPYLFNTAWNYAGDLAASLPTGFEKHDYNKATLKIYDKLFWGLNLPAVTPPGKRYSPTWKQKEVLLLRDVMKDAVDSFRRALLNPSA